LAESQRFILEGCKLGNYLRGKGKRSCDTNKYFSRVTNSIMLYAAHVGYNFL
jgi:hypothetical protein